MKQIKLGMWQQGIDMISSETDLPEGAARDVVNGDVDREGNFTRRKGRTQIAALNDASVVWTSKVTGKSYLTTNGVLNSFTISPTYTLTPIGVLGSSEPPSFCDLLDKVVVSTVAGCFTLDSDDTMTPLGIDAPGTPVALPDMGGGLAAGRYGVAFAFLRGTEESGVSPVRFVDVVAGGGILINVPSANDNTVTSVRVYRTATNGDTLYLAETLPVGTGAHVLGNSSLGKQSDTIYRTRIRGGQIVRHWRGRLMVARGSTLQVSDAMRYGVVSERHGFVQFPHHIDLLEPVNGGVFVGHKGGVVFLQGSGPEDWQQTRVTASAPVFGTGCTVASSALGGDVANAANGYDVALWQAAEGYVVGLSSGQAVTPQAARLKLSPAKTGAMVVHQRRIISTEIM